MYHAGSVLKGGLIMDGAIVSFKVVLNYGNMDVKIWQRQYETNDDFIERVKKLKEELGK